MIALKFGGSAIGNAQRIYNVGEIINTYLSKKPIVVLSAIGDTTDLLIQAGNNALQGRIDGQEIRELHYSILSDFKLPSSSIDPLLLEINNILMGISLIKEFSKKTFDTLISYGERISVRVVSEYLNKIGIKSKAYDAWDIGMVTDSNFTNAEVLDSSFINIRSNLSYLETNYDHVPIITGFIGKNENGEITTLGRGGSDLSVCVIGAALDVEEVQVWKDVDGILSCDPKIVKNPLTLDTLTYEEASELAYFGAKVLHPRALHPAMKMHIPVYVKNYLYPEKNGTKIINEQIENEKLLQAITVKRNVLLIDVVSSRMLGSYGFLAKVFGILRDLKISVDMVATSEVSISFTLDFADDIDLLVKELSKIASVEVKNRNSIISLIGNVKKSSEILLMTFQILNDLGINIKMISQGASKVNIGFIVNDDEADKCVEQLHQKFFYGV
ncbi:MAG TPA: aspartate kinase [Ignavibacteria bacterium]